MINKIKADDFSIIKQNKKDFKKSVIQRSNLTNEFTIEDIENHLRQMAKDETQLTSQIKITTAAIGNVERNHPTIAMLSDEQLSVAIYMGEAKEILRKANSKLRDIKATKKKYAEVTDTIYKKFGFVPTELPEDEKTK